MTFKCRFNATCFLFKINRFVLIFSKTSNRFVLKICSGGFADYNSSLLFHPSAFPQCLRYNPLKLPVSGAELICRPLFDCLHCFGIHTKHKAFYSLLFCHSAPQYT